MGCKHEAQLNLGCVAIPAICETNSAMLHLPFGSGIISTVQVLYINLLLVLFCFEEEDILPKETKQEGAVSLDTYLQYFKSLHSLSASLFVILLFTVTQVSKGLCVLVIT